MLLPGAAPAFPEKKGRGAEHPPVVRRVLPNGLTLLIQEDPTHPLVAFHAVVPTGSATEGKFLGTGISHVLEHMLFKGTQRRPVGAVEREARSYGGTTQGFTSYDTTSYQVLVNREYWSQAADLLVDALFFPSMDPEEFRKEREVVLRELKMRADDPAQIVWDHLFARAYRVHPYRIPIIGYEPLLETLEREDAVAYHRLHYHPNRMVIAVVGDIQAEAVARRLEELTREIPPGRVHLTVLPEEPAPAGPQEWVETSAHANLGLAAVGFPSVSADHRDLFALDLLAWILGGGRGSQLDLALKETGWVHSVGAWNYTPRRPGLFVVTLRSDPERLEEAVERLFKRLEEARQGRFDPAQVQAAQKTLLRGYLEDRQTVGGQASDLASYELLVGDPGFAYRYLKGMERVGLRDLTRVARRYLDPQRATTVKLFPEGYDLATPERERGPVQEPQVRKEVLSNGLTVLLRQDSKLPLVSAQVSMEGGVRFENEATQGISQMTARMLLRGTPSRSAEEITTVIRGMGGQLSPFSGRNTLGLSMEVMSSQLPEAVALLGDLVENATFPPEEMEKERRLALAELKAMEEDPFPWGMRRLAATLFTVHPYRLDPAGRQESLSALSREAMADFYRRVRNPKRMVATFVGDFDEALLLEKIRMTLGRIEPGAGGPPAVPEEPALTGIREHAESTPRQEGLILIGFPGLRVSDPRVEALDLIQALLSGGAGRLFAEVRERQGLAYTVGAFAVHGVDPGFFVLYAITDPAQLSKVREALLGQVRRLREEPVPGEELHQAKQGLLGTRRIQWQTQGALAAQMSLDELYGLGYDHASRSDANVLAVTSEEIQATALALLDPERIAVVIGTPAQAAGAAGSGDGAKRPVAAAGQPLS